MSTFPYRFLKLARANFIPTIPTKIFWNQRQKKFRDWLQKKDSIQKLEENNKKNNNMRVRKSFFGGGYKLHFSVVEKGLDDWICEVRSKKHGVSIRQGQNKALQ